MRKTLLGLVIIPALLLTACNPVLRTHGYIATEKEKPQEVDPNTDTKATVLSRLGNPSVKGTFDERESVEDETWYYITSIRQSYAYLRPQIEDRTIVAVSFNPDGQVSKVAEYGIEDGRYVNYSDRKTPTRGRQLNTLEQIFGTIGAIPTDRIAGQNQNPGGGLPGGR